MKYIYTFGGDNQPYENGYTEVLAPDRKSADALFRAYHPDRIDGVLNCADVFPEGRRDVDGPRHEMIYSSIEKYGC
jgi:hypothetical protein